MAKKNRYSKLIEHIFFEFYKQGDREVGFVRSDIEKAAEDLSDEELCRYRLASNLS